MSSVNFTPPLIKPVKPDFPKIREIVADKIAASEAKDRPKEPSAEPSPNGSASAKPTKSPKPSTNQAEDLDTVCAVSD